MKQILFIFFILIQLPIYGHGFSANTLVRIFNNWCRIEQICRSIAEEDFYITSYDVNKNFLVKNQVQSAGESESNCYIRLGFDEWFNDDIVCTPTQEFYLSTTKQWIPAYQLKVGDELLSASNPTWRGKSITHIEFVKRQLNVYSIEVKSTHTFLVGRYCIVTHNMLLPALTVGLSIPFGAAAGGAAGSFLGPATFAAGIVVGGLVGIAVKKFACDGQIPKYTLWFNSNEIEKQFKNTEQKNNEGNHKNSEDPEKNKKNKENSEKIRDKRSNKELEREINSLTKQMYEHQNKLKEYIKNPDTFDNKGLLRNAKTIEQRMKIINGRINHLNREIRAFQSGIDKAIKILKERI
jgi:hypothetical protein